MTPSPETLAAPTPRRRLRRRLVVVLVVLVLPPMLLLGWVLTGRYQRAAESAATARLQLAADAVAAALGRAVDGITSSLETVANLLADNASDIARVTAVVGASPDVGSVAIYDHEGALIDTIRKSNDPHQAPPRLAPETLAEVAARGRWVGNLEGVGAGADATQIPAEQAHIGVVLPVSGSGRTWYVRAAIGSKVLSTLVHDVAEGVLLSEDRADISRSLFVVDRQRRAVAHANVELVATAADLSDEAALKAFDTKASANAPVYGASQRFVAGGEPWLAWTRTTRDVPFIIVAQTPVSVALADFERVRRGVIAAVAIVGAAVLVIGILLARRLTAPLEALTRWAHALGSRDFHRRFEIRTGDEIETVADAMHSAGVALARSEEQREREVAIRTDLGRYLPAPLVERVVARDHSLALGGQRRTLTLLFADVAGFTSLAERHPPETVVALLGQLFTLLTEVVFRHGGTVDKLVGDSMLAVWNMAEDQPDHAARALAAARDMRRWVDAGNRVWRRDFGATIALSIGVHSGDAVVGNLGSETRMEYTCVGDAVNVASTLERMARPQQVVTTEATFVAAGRPTSLRPLGPHALPGRLEHFELFELVV